MKYYIAKFNIDCESSLKEIARELLADGAVSAGFESFENTEDGINGYVQTCMFDKSTLDDLISNFDIPNIIIEYSISEAEDKNWNKEWEECGFSPIDIDGRCLIYDAKRGIVGSTDIPLKIGIEAELAFGTGTHQTTQMIVGTLLDMSILNKNVLDCGCGTGILGIVASKLGAKSVFSYDIDEWSVENTKHNMELNNVCNINVKQGDANVLSDVMERFDIVLANINRNILLADMSMFKSVMNSDATLILSGFYEDDVYLLQQKAEGLNLHIERKITNEDWTCLILK